jgi:small subunit ribosomal protein S1
MRSKSSSNAWKTMRAWSSSPKKKPPTSRTGKRSSRSSKKADWSKARSRASSKAASWSTSAWRPSSPAARSISFPPKDLSEYLGKVYEFKIVKINDERKNIVLSRREVIEAERAEQRQKFLDGVTPGDKVIGMVKNITDFGAFVDLNGMDGLLHITDMSWGRLNHPSEMLGIGQKIEVVRFWRSTARKNASPSVSSSSRTTHGKTSKPVIPSAINVHGKVTKLVAYGAFVEVEEGVEGLIHVSELSWTKRIARPSDVLTVGQEVNAVVLGINKEERKISLGVRQLDTNPWDDIDARYPSARQMKRPSATSPPTAPLWSWKKASTA